MPRISVIVPVFNTENYITECLKSLVNQTFSDFEVIIVDDGSTDRSRAIAECFTSDPRFKLFRKENGGLVSARKFGFQKSRGEYISFVDSDDVLNPFFLERHYMHLCKDNCDVSVSGFYVWFSRSGDLTCNLTKDERVVNKLEFAKAILSLKNTRKIGTQGGYLFNKLFKRDIIYLEDFVESSGAEDEVFLFHLLPRISKVSFFPTPLYYYRRAGRSLSTRIGWRLAHIQSRRKIVDDTNGDLKRIAIAGLATQIASTVLCVKGGSERDPKTINSLKEEISLLQEVIKDEGDQSLEICPFDVKKELRAGLNMSSPFGPFFLFYYGFLRKVKKLIK